MPIGIIKLPGGGIMGLPGGGLLYRSPGLAPPALAANQIIANWGSGVLSIAPDPTVDLKGALFSFRLETSIGDSITHVVDPDDFEQDQTYRIPFDILNQSGWVQGQATFNVDLYLTLKVLGSDGILREGERSAAKQITIDQTDWSFFDSTRFTHAFDTTTGPAGHRLVSVDADVRVPPDYLLWGYSGNSETGPTTEQLEARDFIRQLSPGIVDQRTLTALGVGTDMYRAMFWGHVSDAAAIYRITEIIGPVTVPDLDAGTRPIFSVAPSIAGTGDIGEELTGDDGTDDGDSRVYQWMRGDAEIAGATSIDYTPTAADDGHEIGLRVRATETSSGLSTDAISNVIVAQYNAPTVGTVIPDQSFAIGSGEQALDVTGNFAVDGDATLAGVTWSISGPATISAAGIVTMPTDAIMSATNVTVTATNSGGSVQDTFTLTVTASTDFPADVDSGDWSTDEERDSADAGGVSGLRFLTLDSGITVPDGFALLWYSGTNSAGDPSLARDVTADIGQTILSPSSLNVGDECYSYLYWKKSATGETDEAGSKANFTIQGLLTPPSEAHPITVLDWNELQILKSRITNQLEPHWTAYQRLLTEANAALNWNEQLSTNIPTSINITTDTVDPSRTTMKNIGERAYALALKYAITGGQTYGDKAKAIMMRCATRNGATGMQLTNSEGAGLHIGSHFMTMAYAYDLLVGVGYTPWSAGDKTTYRNWFVAEAVAACLTTRAQKPIGQFGSSNHLDAALNLCVQTFAAFDMETELDDALDDLHKYVVFGANPDWRIRKYPYGANDAQVCCMDHDIGRDNGLKGIQYTGYGAASVCVAMKTAKRLGRATWNTATTEGCKGLHVWNQYFRWKLLGAPFTFSGSTDLQNNPNIDYGSDSHHSVGEVLLYLYPDLVDADVRTAIINLRPIRGLIDPHCTLTHVPQSAVSPFPGQIASNLLQVTEVRSGSVVGKRELRTLSGVTVPSGFELRWCSSTVQGGTATTAATMNVSSPVPGTFTFNVAPVNMSVGQTCHNAWFWRRLSDNAWQKAAADMPGFLIEGLETAPPSPVTAPAVTGNPVEGQTLTVSDGTWDGSPAPAFAYQWRRGGANISGATANTRLLAAADVGFTIDCVVTATNASGSASASSNLVGPVTATADIPSIADSVWAARSTIPSDGAANELKVRIDVGNYTLPAPWEGRVTRSTDPDNDPNVDGVSTALGANSTIYSVGTYADDTTVYVKAWVRNTAHSPEFVQSGETREVLVEAYPVVGGGTLALMNAQARTDAYAKQLSEYDHAAAGGSWSNCGIFGPAAMAEALSAFSGDATAITHCVNQILHTTAANARQEPLCAGGYWNQHETHVTSAIAIYRHTPAVWNHANVSDITRQRLDLIARAAAISAMYMMSANGLGADGNGPNMRGHEAANTRRVGGAININAPMSATVLSSMAYFGGHAAMQAMADAFDLAAFITEAANLGMVQIKETFNARNEPASSAKSIVPGSAPTAGQLATSLANWTHINGRPLSDVAGLFTAVINQSWGKTTFTNNENGINVLVNGQRRGRTINIDEVSPFGGQAGMFTEYDAGDGGGIGRCSTHYAITSPQSVVNAIAAQLCAGIYPKAALAGLVAKMNVGYEDIRWKLAAGAANGGGHLDVANGGNAGSGDVPPTRWYGGDYGGRYREAIWFDVVYPTISS